MSGKIYKYNFYDFIHMRGGKCVLDPMDGMSLETIFTVQCIGYADTDLPLRYSFEIFPSKNEVLFSYFKLIFKISFVRI